MWQENSGILDVIGLAVKGSRKKLIRVVVMNIEVVSGKDCSETISLMADEIGKIQC